MEFKASTTDQTIDSILNIMNGISKNDALKEFSLLMALSKRDKYKLECRKFQKKYQSEFKKFEEHLHSQKNHEDYEKENDSDDWEFALSSLHWWEEKIREM